jgi:hypothetical protein
MKKIALGERDAAVVLEEAITECKNIFFKCID